jgi:phosphatidylethanolamine-binding protein (PEBP) family uncharacterized protein
MPVRKLAAFFLLGAGGLLLPNCSSDSEPAAGNTAGTSSGGNSSVAGTTSSGGSPTAGTGSGGGGASSGGHAGSSSAGASGSSAGVSSAGSSTGGASGSGGVGGGTGGAGGAAGGSGGSSGGSSGAGGGSSGGFSLTSPDLAEGAKFGDAFVCTSTSAFGSGVNPDLKWSGVPSGTMSFAITFIDTKIGENSAMGQHWAAWDIPAAAMEFPKGTTMLTGALAGAKQTNKYLAPCPSGADTYEFKIFALPMATLNVTGAEGTGTANSAGVAKVLAALKAATPLGTATLHGTYGPAK